MKTARRSKGLITPISLEDLYVHRGRYSAKMSIDPKQSTGMQEVQVVMKNADGATMACDYRRWGTKLTLSFELNESTPEGVVVIDVLYRLKNESQSERFSFWVVS